MIMFLALCQQVLINMQNNIIKIRVNPDEETASIAREAVRANDGYCPCKIERNKDTKCMCKEFRDAVKYGNCTLCECGLYESYKEKDQ